MKTIKAVSQLLSSMLQSCQAETATTHVCRSNDSKKIVKKKDFRNSNLPIEQARRKNKIEKYVNSNLIFEV